MQAEKESKELKVFILCSGLKIKLRLLSGLSLMSFFSLELLELVPLIEIKPEVKPVNPIEAEALFTLAVELPFLI